MKQHKQHFLSVLLFALLLLALPANHMTIGRYSVTMQPGVVGGAASREVWHSITELAWRSATTGWQPVAGGGGVAVGISMAWDASGQNRPLVLNGQRYDAGLSTYPLSEIVYDLNGGYTRFVSDVGIDDSAPAGAGGLVFAVYLDGVLAWKSGIHRGGSARETVDLPLSGISRMRLVVATADAGSDSPWNVAIWGGARLLEGGAPEAAAKLDMLATRRIQLLDARQDALASLDQRSAETLERLKSALAHVPAQSIQIAEDRAAQQVWIANQSIAAGFYYGGENLGFLQIVDRTTGKLAVYDTAGSITTDLTGHLDLHKDVQAFPPLPFSSGYQNDPLLGASRTLSVHLQTARGNMITLEATLGETQPALLYRLVVHDAPTASVAQHGFRFFDLAAGSHLGIVTPDLPDLSKDQPLWQYLTAYSRTRQGSLHADGLLHREPVAPAAPVLIWSGTAAQPGLVLADLDSDRADGEMAARLDEGQVSAGIELASSKGFYVKNPATGKIDLQSARLLIALTPNADPRDAFVTYRELLDRLYPAIARPDWVQYRWDSWYAAGMDVSADNLLSQVAAIERKLGDLGTWTIYIDAGWYISEGRQGGSWTATDTDKFPAGLRAFVDEAHRRGAKVLLYLSFPYVDDQERAWNWLGLPGEIAQHSDMLIPLAEVDRAGGTITHHYAFDIRKPETQAYIEEILSNFYDDYGVDGIVLDGLGDIHEQENFYPSRNAFGQVPEVVDYTLAWYKLIYDLSVRLGHDPFIVAGWMAPPAARAYAHEFYHSDEYPVFDRGYPNSGLRQHVDAAIMQKLMFGQTPMIGYVWGAPDDKELAALNFDWMAAGLAMNAPPVLSYDLNALSGSELGQVRALLQAFQNQSHAGQTYFAFAAGKPYLNIESATGASSDTNSGSDAALYPDSFATTMDDVTYLAGINRNTIEEGAQKFSFTLPEYGVPGDRPYIVYDVKRKTAQQAQYRFEATLPAETVELYALRSTPGVLWTDSNVDQSVTGTQIKLTVDGPAEAPGFAAIYVPGYSGITLDGVPLAATDHTAVYDPASGLLTLTYSHDTRHVFTIQMR